MIPLYFGLGMSIIDVMMESLCKYYTVSNSCVYLILACVLYATQPLFFSKALKYENMSTMNVIWNVVSTCLIIIIGIFLFQEKITTTKCLGIILSIISLILLGI